MNEIRPDGFVADDEAIEDVKIESTKRKRSVCPNWFTFINCEWVFLF